MFSNLVIGFVAGLGVAGWVYARAQRNTGNLTKSSLIAAAAAGVITLLLVTFLASLVPRN